MISHRHRNANILTSVTRWLKTDTMQIKLQTTHVAMEKLGT